jgi:hypothetical protein
MLRLEERIAAKIEAHARLRGVPVAVIEDVLAIGLDWLTDHVPMETHAHQLTEIDWSACEACGHLVDGQEPEGAVYESEDGSWLCAACAEDGGPGDVAEVAEYQRVACAPPQCNCDIPLDGTGGAPCPVHAP